MDALKPRTADVNGALWQARARDWAEVQEGIVRPAFAALLDRCGVTSGSDYLDLGCGSGMAAAMAAERGARVSGVDAAEGLLTIARERTPAGDFRQGDLEALPFDDDAFDVATFFNAVQYAGNPVIALEEARRVVRTGGAIGVMVWGDPAAMEMAAVIKSLGPLLPPPPPGAGGPFALSDETALRGLVEAAGLTVVDVFDVDDVVTYADLDTALRGLNSSGVAARARQVSGEEQVTSAHRDALAPFHQGDGSYRISASFRCLLARA